MVVGAGGALTLTLARLSLSHGGERDLGCWFIAEIGQMVVGAGAADSQPGGCAPYSSAAVW